MLLGSTTASISCIVLGLGFSSFAVALDAFAGLPRGFRPLPGPGNLRFASLFVGISFTIEMKVPLLTTRLGLRSVELEPTMPSADFCRSLASSLDATSSAWTFFFAHASQIGRSPRVMRIPFTLMTVASTSTLSVSVWGFDDMCRLTQRARLMRFLFVDPALCLRLPSDSTSRWTPLPSG